MPMFLFVKSSEVLLNESTGVFQATQYGAIFLNHDTQSVIVSSDGSNSTLFGATRSQECSNNPGDYLDPSECQLYGTGIGYTVAYNFTALHSAVSDNKRQYALVPSKQLITSI